MKSSLTLGHVFVFLFSSSCAAQGLHEVHREFFARPKALDMLTKPRQQLREEPIVAKLVSARKAKPLEIAAKYPFQINGAGSSEGSKRRPRALQPARKPPRYEGGLLLSASPLSATRGIAHTDSYTAPFALARPTPGKHLFVPASLVL